MEHYLSLAVKSIFVENILLSFFLGMCSYLAISKKIEPSIGLGMAVVFVNGLCTPVNWVIKNFLLDEGALYWIIGENALNVDLTFLAFIAYIATISAMVQLVEMVIERFSPKLYTSLGVFLPLIAVNCSILGASLFMAERDYNFAESVVFGTSSGVGFALAILSMAAIRYKIQYSNIPNGLKGLGITMILTGLISMAYLSFSGIKL